MPDNTPPMLKPTIPEDPAVREDMNLMLHTLAQMALTLERIQERVVAPMEATVDRLIKRIDGFEASVMVKGGKVVPQSEGTDLLRKVRRFLACGILKKHETYRLDEVALTANKWLFSQFKLDVGMDEVRNAIIEQDDMVSVEDDLIALRKK